MSPSLGFFLPDVAGDTVSPSPSDAAGLFETAAAPYCLCPEIHSIADEPSDSTYRERELRTFCSRLVGWADEASVAVDQLIHTLLFAAARRTPIALRGASDLVPVAYALHRRLFGSGPPFVVCDPRRREGDGSVRSPPNRRTALLALDAALGGSVCVRAHRLPRDFESLAASFRHCDAVAMIFVCLQGTDPVRDLLCPPIEIPFLADRAPDLDRLLDEYLSEAADVLGVRGVRLTEVMRESILRDVESLADLEKTALRLVALVSSRNTSAAAARLRIAPVSLSRWLSRRPWSRALRSDVECCDADDNTVAGNRATVPAPKDPDERIDKLRADRSDHDLDPAGPARARRAQ